MKINVQLLNLTLTKQCKNSKDLQGIVSPATITRIRKGGKVGTKTAGKLAKALNIPVEQLIIQESA